MPKINVALLLLLVLLLSGCTRGLAPAATVPPEVSPPPPATLAPEPTRATATPTLAVVVAPRPTPAATARGTVLVADNLSAGDPYIPQLGNRGYDVRHYTLRLTLDPAQALVVGETTVEALSTMDALEQVSLDLVGFDVGGVTVGGTPAPFFRQEGKLIVDLPGPLDVGDPFSLTVAYAGTPVQEPSPYVPMVDHLGLFSFPPDWLFVAAEPDGARYWYPVNDHPRDKATYRIELTVPAGFVGVANGDLVETTRGVPHAFAVGGSGDRYDWELDRPCASAFVTVAVGHFDRVEGTSPGGVPLRSYVSPELRSDFDSALDVGAAVDWMVEMFGPYPFASFGYVTVSGLGSSLETETMVLLGQEASLEPSTMVHEMAHMWFGDWVSLDSWGQIWRSEGMATYVDFMWQNRNLPGALDRMIDGVEEGLAAARSLYPMGNPPRRQMFGRDSYLKGAVFFHRLRQEMGDEAFFQGLRAYLDRYGGRTATDADFQAVMEEAAGKSLEKLFAKWLR